MTNALVCDSIAKPKQFNKFVTNETNAKQKEINCDKFGNKNVTCQCTGPEPADRRRQAKERIAAVTEKLEVAMILKYRMGKRLLAGMLAGAIGISSAGLSVQAQEKDTIDSLTAGASLYLGTTDVAFRDTESQDGQAEIPKELPDRQDEEDMPEKETVTRLSAGAPLYLTKADKDSSDGASKDEQTKTPDDTQEEQTKIPDEIQDEQKAQDVSEKEAATRLHAGVALYMAGAENTEEDTLVMANVNDSLNVRAEADEEAETVGKLFKNCGGEILERADGWTKLRSGKLEGWAKDDYLLFGEEAAALREEAGALTAFVQTDSLRVRKEADSEAGIYGLVGVGDEFEVKDQNDEWVAIQYDDDQLGYVSADYVDVKYTVPTGKTKQQIADEERAKELAKLSKNQGAVPTSVSDVQLLAALIQCEAGSQPYEGKLAVGAAVMNRVRSGGYPNSIMAVITAPGQFPPATNGKVAGVVARGASSSCVQAAQEAVNGATNIGGATHFNRVGSHDGIVIGGHVFW